VEQPEAQVAIQQPEPQVEIDAPAPEVEVTQAKPNVTVEQHEPSVTVEQKEPEVRVDTAEADVEVTSEEPKVVVEQGEPEVVIERVSSADATVEEADEGTEVAMAETEANTEAETAAMTEREPAADKMAWLGGSPEELEGETVVNAAGEDIGSVDEIVRENATGDLFIVVSVGGFLGIGDKDVVFPLSQVSMEGDRVVIDTTLTEEALSEREEYDEDHPQHWRGLQESSDR